MLQGKTQRRGAFEIYCKTSPGVWPISKSLVKIQGLKICNQRTRNIPDRETQFLLDKNWVMKHCFCI